MWGAVAELYLKVLMRTPYFDLECMICIISVCIGIRYMYISLYNVYMVIMYIYIYIYVYIYTHII